MADIWMWRGQGQFSSVGVKILFIYTVHHKPAGVHFARPADVRWLAQAPTTISEAAFSRDRQAMNLQQRVLKFRLGLIGLDGRDGKWTFVPRDDLYVFHHGDQEAAVRMKGPDVEIEQFTRSGAIKTWTTKSVEAAAAAWHPLLTQKSAARP